MELQNFSIGFLKSNDTNDRKGSKDKSDNQS